MKIKVLEVEKLVLVKPQVTPSESPSAVVLYGKEASDPDGPCDLGIVGDDSYALTGSVRVALLTHIADTANPHSPFQDGDIILFYNQLVANILPPWYFCDRTNGTPDLRDKCVFGISDDDSMGDTGGSDTPAGAVAWPAGVPTFAGAAMADHGHGLIDQSDGGKMKMLGPSGTVNKGGTTAAVADSGHIHKQDAGSLTEDASAGTPSGTISWPAGVPTFSGSSGLPPYVRLGYKMFKASS